MILRYRAGVERVAEPQRSLRTAFARLWVERGADPKEALRGLSGRPAAPPDPSGEGPLEQLVREGMLRVVDGRLEAGPDLRRAVREAALEFVREGEPFPVPAGGAGPRPPRIPAPVPEELWWTRPWRPGDDPRSIDWGATLRNARFRSGRPGALSEDDLEVHETESDNDGAAVVLIDASGSMVGSGEDRLTPAKLAAIGLAEHLRRRRRGGSLDVVAFGERAWRVPVDELPALSAGPRDTNTAEGLRLSRELLRRRGGGSRSIALITDGKPTCAWDGKALRRRPAGMDRRVLDLTLEEGRRCAREGCRITTFLVAEDPPLVEFVDRFSEAVGGGACLVRLDDLGGLVLRDWESRRGR